MKKTTTILCLSDQPQEKLINTGRNSLTDSELLAVIIGKGDKTDKSLLISRQILASVNYNLTELSKKNVSELMQFDGIGKSTAAQICSLFELGRRKIGNEAGEKRKISSSRDAFNIMSPILSDLQHEEFWIILLNRANKIIGKKQISSGGVAGTVADPKIIFKFALDSLASALVLCHNHPSGNTQPSEADNQLTKKIKEAGRLLDITVLDHIIVAEKAFYSYADEGKL